MERSTTTQPSSATPIAALMPDTPPDATFRRLARMAEERARGSGLVLPGQDAEQEAQDQRTAWGICQMVAQHYARWARRLPAFITERTGAGHVALALNVLSPRREGEPDSRMVQRFVYFQFTKLLKEEGIDPVPELSLCQALWAGLQMNALHAASAPGPKPGSKQEQSAYWREREQVLGLREELVLDMCDLALFTAQFLYHRLGAEEAKAEEAKADEAASAPPPQEQPAPDEGAAPSER